MLFNLITSKINYKKTKLLFCSPYFSEISFPLQIMWLLSLWLIVPFFFSLIITTNWYHFNPVSSFLFITHFNNQIKRFFFQNSCVPYHTPPTHFYTIIHQPNPNSFFQIERFNFSQLLAPLFSKLLFQFSSSSGRCCFQQGRLAPCCSSTSPFMKLLFRSFSS